MLWILIVIFVCMSIMFLMGKGTSLIAGYNTASLKEREKYDEKKLCLVMGIGFAVISLSLLVLKVFEDAYGLSMILMLGAVAFIVIGINFFCQNKEFQKEKTFQIKTILSAAFPLVIVGFVTVMMFSGSVNITLEDNELSVGTSGVGVKTIEVIYDDIEDINYMSDLDIGKRSWGIGSAKIQAGKFVNDEFGRYQLYSYTRCHDYIVLKTNESYIVINQEDESQTKELYETLEKKVK